MGRGPGSFAGELPGLTPVERVARDGNVPGVDIAIGRRHARSYPLRIQGRLSAAQAPYALRRVDRGETRRIRLVRIVATGVAEPADGVGQDVIAVARKPMTVPVILVLALPA